MALETFQKIFEELGEKCIAKLTAIITVPASVQYQHSFADPKQQTITKSGRIYRLIE